MAINFKQLADAMGGSTDLPRAVTHWRLAAAFALAVLVAIGLVKPVESATVSNVRITRHNLSTSNIFSGTPVKAQSETQICVFCHTPHGASTDVRPLWNRTTNAPATYTKYSSSSLDATTIQDALNGVTGGSSILCLSCHDGQIALGNVLVLGGQARSSASGTDDILLSNTAGAAGTAGATMPAGSGATTGYTRLLGTSLTNDHPISITYDHNLALADGELRDLDVGTQRYPTGTGTVIGIPASGYKPLLPLAPSGTDQAGQVQCATCHDPHITNEKFLRLNRLQVNAAPSGGAFNETNDIICLACHDKLGTAWSLSAHADSTIANEAYVNAPATTREFATGTKVWEAACLNCHDTHAVQGTRRLLREGTDATPATALSAGGFKAGGKPAIEETCYQCHTTSARAIIAGTFTGAGSTSNVIPDIYSEFTTAGNKRMPISYTESKETTKEAHDVRNADLIECRKAMGNPGGVVEISSGAGTNGSGITTATCDAGETSSDNNRHVECSDCHNPHRVVRSYRFDNTTNATYERTHKPGGDSGWDGNIASGVLRGTWGVEIAVSSISADGTWPEPETKFSYAVKRGNPTNTVAGLSTGHPRGRDETFLTREYQLCFKCHSGYANPSTYSSYPSLGHTGGTASATNGLTKYTNVAAEFLSVNAQDPAATSLDQGEETNTSGAGGPCAGDCNPTPTGPADGATDGPGSANNHRSWHPVVWPTGRNKNERGSTSWANIRPPFNNNIGTQTMQCSDCHGNSASWTQGANATDAANGPNLSKTQGPHGSPQNFILKGIWSTAATPSNVSGANATGYICGRCHAPSDTVSGFAGASEASHNFSPKRGFRCTACHIAVPHGWKNKAFLVNLNCLGTEAGKAAGCTAATSGEAPNQSGYYREPYYLGALLRVTTWRNSGSWGNPSYCTSQDWMSSACFNN